MLDSHVSSYGGRGQNTDPQSMDYLNGLPKWTTPESHLKGEKRLFEARHIIVLTIPYAFALETFHTCDPSVSLHNPNPNPSNSCFSPFKWLSGVVHLGNPFRQSMDWGSVFCPLPVMDIFIGKDNIMIINAQNFSYIPDSFSGYMCKYFSYTIMYERWCFSSVHLQSNGIHVHHFFTRSH